jgi:ribosomal protein S18 acetylase RimI-like enzyme
MWVDPAARGLGVATSLIAAVADWAIICGAKSLRLSVMPGNEAARRTYEKNGFEITLDAGYGREVQMTRAL